ncbi:MAG: tetratricopeptide repeat protein [Methyloceanibacter sp.]|nr:tetratricopeptide repeat protein [Methyloceanibacter sp.]
MTDRDSFLREVDEAVRQDQYRKLWDNYGVYALAGALLIVAGVAAYKGWSYWQERQAQDAGAKFSEALTLEGGDDEAKAHELLTSLAAQGPEGYRALARFQLAAAEAKAGDIDKAVADYDALASDASVDQILQGHAALQAAALRLDKADYAEMERRLKGLVDSNSAWRFSARELLGLSAYRLNNKREAEKQFSALIGDEDTPPNLRERADMMLALIVGTPQSLSTTAK